MNPNEIYPKNTSRIFGWEEVYNPIPTLIKKGKK